MPNKLFKIIAPSSAFYYNEQQFALAVQRLADLGIDISYGKNIGRGGFMGSASIIERVDEIVDAFTNPKIDGIMAIIGGINSEELLDYIPWDIIAKNPKFFCGFSDITVLQNALLAKCDMVTFSGPHFSSFYMKHGFDYTLENFKKALAGGEYAVQPSTQWANDKWWIEQENRTFYKNNGWKVINPGTANGRIIGGNLSSFAILQGTEYMPDFKNSVLFLEESTMQEEGTEATFQFFLRQLGGLIKQPGFDGVRGIAIGRFHTDAGVTDKHLEYIVESHPKLKNIPIIANLDFGHTVPIFTFPIGGQCEFNADANGKIDLKLKTDK